MIVEEKGYAPVECDEFLPCPFCGQDGKLHQVSHYKYGGKRYTIMSSTRTQVADTFWVSCSRCRATTGNHQKTAQGAAELWNTRMS